MANGSGRVVVATALLALAGAGWVLLPGAPDPVVKAAVANVVLAGVLAAVTTWYALLTRQIAQASLAAVAEARTQREAGLRPVLIFEWAEGSEPAGPAEPSFPVLGVRNVGPGPALNVRVVLAPPGDAGGPPGDASGRPDPYPLWSGMALAPGAALRVEGLLAGEFERGLQAVGPRAVLRAEYRDVFGTGWRTHAALTVYDTGGVATGAIVFEPLPASAGAA